MRSPGQPGKGLLQIKEAARARCGSLVGLKRRLQVEFKVAGLVVGEASLRRWLPLGPRQKAPVQRLVLPIILAQRQGRAAFAIS